MQNSINVLLQLKLQLQLYWQRWNFSFDKRFSSSYYRVGQILDHL